MTRMKSITSIVFLTLCVAALATASPNKFTPENIVEQAENKLTKKMDEYREKDSISIYGDMITLEKIDPTQENRDTTSRVDNDPLIARIDDFLRCRKLHIRLPSDGSTADLLGRALGEKDIEVQLGGLSSGASEARTRLKRIILPILLALKLKALIVLPIVITMIGLVGIKGLGAGLLALMLSGAVALKALLTSPPPLPARVSYGVVKPHEIHHEHWHRSQEEINQPYRAWAPEYNVDPYHFDLP